MALRWRLSYLAVSLFCCVFPSLQGQRSMEGSVRLQREQEPGRGYLGVFHNGSWGRVCDTHWDEENAAVVCRQLGYEDTVYPVEELAEAPPRDPPRILDQVRCTGEEWRLVDCPKAPWGQLRPGCRTATVHCIHLDMPGPADTSEDYTSEMPTEYFEEMTDYASETDMFTEYMSSQGNVVLQPTPGTGTDVPDYTVAYAVVAALVGVLLLTVVAFIGMCLVRRHMKPRREPAVDLRTGPPEYMNPVDPEVASNADVYEDVGLPSWAARWEISRANLLVEDKVLGRGDFGEVRAGTVIRGQSRVKAAIKTLKDRASAEEKINFLEEFRTMTSIGHHPNVVSLLGACQHQGTDVQYVALEYLPNGDLRSYLRRSRSTQPSSKRAPLTSRQMVRFAYDVAKGMKHLAMSGVIHRDLAARNVLLGEGLVAKVSDFGLSRGEDIYVQSSKGAVPVRWLAIESLTHKKYSTMSDVWSFGILLWEISTLGGTPYPTIGNRDLVGQLSLGFRMGKPANCGDKIYALMLRCWDEEPDKRPSFADLIVVLDRMGKSKENKKYFALEGPKHYDNIFAIRPELEDQ